MPSWAPPGSVAIQTPAGKVIDLGCEFDLEVDEHYSRVSVRSGWVQLENELEESADPSLLEAIVVHARVGDVLTLITLIDRGGPHINRIASRAAELWPLPDGVTVSGIVRGDKAGLWLWRDTLPLPPPKGWLRNWRDALPQWLAMRGR